MRILSQYIMLYEVMSCRIIETYIGYILHMFPFSRITWTGAFLSVQKGKESGNLCSRLLTCAGSCHQEGSYVEKVGCTDATTVVCYTDRPHGKQTHYSARKTSERQQYQTSPSYTYRYVNQKINYRSSKYINSKIINKAISFFLSSL